MSTPTLPEGSHQHRQIAWAGQSGYPGARYCCVCSYSVRLKPSTKCSQPDCPNLACTDCFNDGSFCCSRTEELRRARDIPHPVTFVAVANTPPDTQAPSEHPQADPPHQQPEAETEDNAVREELLSTSPVVLVDMVISLRNEVHGLKTTVAKYRNTSEKIRKQREALVETLNSVDALTQVEQETAVPPPTTQATSALPSKIDHDWQEVCSSHPTWRVWWGSGKPKTLRMVTHDLPEDAETPPPPRHRPGRPTQTTQTPHTANSSQTPPPPGQSSSPPPSLPNRHRHHPSRRTHHHSQPPRTQASPPFCGRCRQRGHTVNYCTETICDFCGHRGHLADQCRKRQAEARRMLECAYCQRRGHTDEECYARAADNRQERLLRAILSEYRPAPPHRPSHVPDYPSWPHPQHTALPHVR